MELVEGETLSEGIARGPLSVEEALPLFQQMARGVEAAHEKGIVHRDLKPVNTKISPSGDIKVLDFGLAKVFGAEVAGAARSESPTITREATAAGVILGTAAYMSPEQARGKSLDKRTDIWSFGCCLYEALSGHAVFLGETISDTLAKILQTEPDWKALPRATPERIRDLIARCLVKDPENRLRDIGDARIAIAHALPEPTAAPSKEAGRASRIAPLALAAAVVFAAPALWSFTRSPAAVRRPVIRSVLPLPPNAALNIGFTGVAISADGRHVAYIVRGRDSSQLYLRALDDLEDTVIDEGSVVKMPFFSSDSLWLSYEKDLRLMRVAVSGGAPGLISELRGSLYGADWSGEQIFDSEAAGSGLLRVPVDGGERETLTVLDDKRRDKSHRLPQALPGGSGVLFTLATSTTESYDDAFIAVLLPTGAIRIVLEGGMQPRYSSTGHIVYARNGALLAVPFDLEKLEVTGSRFR